MRWFQFVSLISLAALACSALFLSMTGEDREDDAEDRESPYSLDEDGNLEFDPYVGGPGVQLPSAREAIAMLAAASSALMLLVSFPFSVVALISDNYDRLVRLFSLPAFLIPACSLGVLFYYVRAHWPLYYGLTEVTAATATIWISIVTPTDNLLAKIVGLLGGIYIIVRGLDNIDKGLKGKNKGLIGKLEGAWKRLFRSDGSETTPAREGGDDSGRRIKE